MKKPLLPDPDNAPLPDLKEIAHKLDFAIAEGEITLPEIATSVPGIHLSHAIPKAPGEVSFTSVFGGEKFTNVSAQAFQLTYMINRVLIKLYGRDKRGIYPNQTEKSLGEAEAIYKKVASVSAVEINLKALDWEAEKFVNLHYGPHQDTWKRFLKYMADSKKAGVERN